MKTPQRNRGDATTRRRTIKPEPAVSETPIREAIGLLDLLAEKLAAEFGHDNEHELATGVFTLAGGASDRLKAQLEQADWMEVESLAAESNALIELMLVSLCARMSGAQETAASGIATLAMQAQRNLTAHAAALHQAAMRRAA
jgi:hypothetical protein